MIKWSALLGQLCIHGTYIQSGTITYKSNTIGTFSAIEALQLNYITLEELNEYHIVNEHTIYIHALTGKTVTSRVI